ncbi:MAG TPA: helix-hairpin-helix domain-containing protein, partial [Flavobacteriales bacterium]|nr:helix-hairpin-helix domain-containing protein [Flavobacteriales bacterium]
RGRRSKRVVRTALEDIPGIGPGTARKLLTRFGSIQGIKDALPEDVSAAIGAKKADVVLKALAAGT